MCIGCGGKRVNEESRPTRSRRDENTHETNEDHADQSSLIVAEPVGDRPVDSCTADGDISVRAIGRVGGAAGGRGEEVVEGEREQARPETAAYTLSGDSVWILHIA